MGAGERAGPALASALPASLRVPLVLLGVTAFLAVALGLYLLNTDRDQQLTTARAETEVLADALVGAGADLRDPAAAGLLARSVLDTTEVRAATVWLGDDARVVSVGPGAPVPTTDEAEAAVAAGTPLVERSGDDALVTTAFARIGGAPVLLATRTPLTRPTIGWSGIASTWILLAVAIVLTSFLLERRRRDRVAALEETVRALYAHDALVTRQQQDLLRSKTEFVNAISQELRAPLGAIKESARRLEHEAGLPQRERGDVVDALRMHVDRLDLLLGDLIDVDRLTQRTVTVRRREVAVAAALDAALEGIDTGDHELVREVAGVTAHVTPGHLERILRCLVHNAVRYGPPGTPVTVRAEREGRVVTITVADRGKGVPTEHRSTVFEPLRQLGDDPGMGLGLALVQRFAMLHGGRAWVEDAPGGGAAVRVVLPDEGAPVRVDPWRVAGAQADDAVVAS